MDAKLSVEIGSEISQLNKGMSDAVRNVQKSAGQIDVATIKIVKDFNTLNRTKFTFGANFQNESRKLDTALTANNTSVKKSKFNYLELGRVLQDAPFGFVGIQNNLTQLIPAAGLAGLAFSALISAITFASVGTDNWTRGLDSNKKAQEKAAQASDEWKENLTGLNKQIFEAQTSSGEEISQLGTLFRATQNLSLSIKDRSLAVKELQDKYPNYFKNLTTENALTDTARKNYNKLKQEIVATSLARAADKDTAKQGEVIFENLNKRASIQKEINKLVAKNNELQSNDKKLANGRTLYGQAIAFNQEKIADLTKETQKYDGAIKNANTTIYNNGQLQDAIIRKFGVQAIVASDAAESVNELKSEIDRIKPIKEDVLLDTFRQSNTKQFELGVKIKPILEVSGFLSDAEKQLAVLSSELGNNISDLLSKSVANGLGESFASIGDALANGGNPIQAFGNAVLGEFGSFLSQFGSLLIQYGIAAGAFAKLQASLLVPGAALISAPLAIAAGLALKLASGAITGLISGGGNSGGSGYKVPGFATGVTNFGGGLALVGERGPELVNLPTGSNVITNQNTNKLVGASRGNSTQVIIPDVRISGQDMVLVFNRANKFNTRR